jgi:hypothetical protein
MYRCTVFVGMAVVVSASFMVVAMVVTLPLTVDLLLVLVVITMLNIHRRSLCFTTLLTIESHLPKLIKCLLNVLPGLQYRNNKTETGEDKAVV